MTLGKSERMVEPLSPARSSGETLQAFEHLDIFIFSLTDRSNVKLRLLSTLTVFFKLVQLLVEEHQPCKPIRLQKFVDSAL